MLVGFFMNSDDTLAITRNEKNPVIHLSSDHEEADTRMVLHASDCTQDHQRIVCSPPIPMLQFFVFMYVT